MFKKNNLYGIRCQIHGRLDTTYNPTILSNCPICNSELIFEKLIDDVQKMVNDISLYGFRVMQKAEIDVKRMRIETISKFTDYNIEDINLLFERKPVEYVYLGLNNIAFRTSITRGGCVRLEFRYKSDKRFSHKLKSQEILSNVFEYVVENCDKQFAKVNRNFIIATSNKLVEKKINHRIFLLFMNRRIRENGFYYIGQYRFEEDDRRHKTRIYKITKGE